MQTGTEAPLPATTGSAIEVVELTKTYLVPVRETGLGAALRSLFRRETRRVEAVKAVTFSIAPGEIVGFIGPNGAGKTTTLKMLSGLLYPTSGRVRVLGFEPFERRKEFLRQMTLVMGQRNQLIWDIPVADSLERNRAIYRLSANEFSDSRDELVELLDLSELLQKPVRNLSLGERMKCEVAAALLHRPRILFLDEPTLGLDVVMQRRIRSFIEAYRSKYEATIILTSHYMADVEALCKRVIVINDGAALFDGDLDVLVRRFTAQKTIIVDLGDGTYDLSDYGNVIAQDGGRYSLQVAKAETPKVTARLLEDLPVVDLSVEDPPIESIIERVFAERPE